MSSPGAMRSAHSGSELRRRGRFLPGGAALLVVATAALAACIDPASACERHLDGHQNGSETQAEVMGGR